MEKEQLIEAFRKKKKWTIKELERKFQCQSSKDFTSLIQNLNALEQERFLCNNHNVYFLIDDDEYMIGKVKDVSKWEFAVIQKDRKVYVPKKYARNIFDKDEVLVHKGKKFNEIIHVYSRGITWVTGTFYWKKDHFIFYSDLDMHTRFLIRNLDDYSLSHRMKAVLKIEKYGDPLVCSIDRLLGYEYEKGMDITAILSRHHVRQYFSEPVMDQANALEKEVNKHDLVGREDFRNLLTVTIDGDDARDFDDAISIESLSSGYRLYVHIADVSYYVKEGSFIDQEAFARSTSIYVADRVVPMLPFSLSNGICSLNPHVDRCTLTCIMDIDSNGHIISSRIVPSVIHSDMRCTYTKVNAFLEGDPDVCKEYESIGKLLKDFETCSRQLQKRAVERGTIDFNTVESDLILDDKGKCIDVRCKERGFAQEMIEQAMISANVCVAHTLNSLQIPGIYRVHEKPDPEKLSSLLQLAQSLGIKSSFYPDDVTPKQLQVFLDSIKDLDLSQIMSTLALRSMQRARYDASCLGHYGLALKEYCHFTSPIRRYPDLIVHRMLRRYLFRRNSTLREKDYGKCERQAYFVSERENEAVLTEREVTDCKKAEYMEDKIGQTFTGKIVSVQAFGFFVELPNTIEGLVPLHSLVDDFYNYDEMASCLTGEATKKKYRLGQKIDVICVGADKLKGQVSFVCKEE